MSEIEDEDRREWESGQWTHLPYFVLRDLVDRGLEETDREIAQTHLEDCSRCRAEFEDLRAFRRALADRRELFEVATTRKKPRSPWPVLGAGGLGLAAGAALVLMVFPLLRPTPPAAPVHASKGGPEESLPGGVPGLLRLYLTPPDSQLTRTIGYWEEARTAQPESAAPYAALIPLYQRAAQRETNPARKAQIQGYLVQLKTRIQELLR